jgi:alpha-tubulin suppressor-like RCC1 family protein
VQAVSARAARSGRCGARAVALAAVAAIVACGEPSAPAPVSFRAVSAGFLHTCALAVGGAAFCWGEDRLGALGNGQRDTNLLVPVRVGGSHSFAALSAGGVDSGHTCAVTPAGEGYCWGNAGFGRLGDGVSGVGAAVTPRAVAGTSPLTAVSAGYDATCGLLSSGALQCWGDGTYGQLGNGAFVTYSLAPLAVSSALTFLAVSAGAQHACAVASSGTAYCWGFNALGALGNGTARDTALPAAVSGGRSFVSVSAGRNHTCAVAADSAGYCWGYNGYGRLGDGTTTASTVPVAVFGGLRFAMIGAGGYHSCGVTSGGTAYCWGSNESGQLGDGTMTDQAYPVPVAGGLRFASVSAGWRHSCGVTDDGVVYCWGLNDHGQLGNGTAASSATPQRIQAPSL